MRFVSLLLIALPCVVDAATINVTSPADDFGPSNGTCSLREAVQAANEDQTYDACAAGESGAVDLIQVPAGLYELTISGSDDTNAKGDLDITQSLKIVGAGMGQTTIKTALPERLFHVIGAANSLALEGMSIADGRGDSGGTCVLAAGPLTMRETVVERCRATGDEAAINAKSTFSMQDSIVRFNTSSGAFSLHGAGLRLELGGELTRVQVYGNRLFATAGASAPARGAGMNVTGGLLVLDSCSFTDNVAMSAESAATGGAIYAPVNVTATRTTFARNLAIGATADSYGGAIVAGGTAKLLLCAFVDNGSRAGGAISMGGGTIEQSTFMYNAATQQGGAISGDFNLKSTIIAQNTAPSGPNIDGTVMSKGHNLIGATQGATIDTTSAGNTADGNFLDASVEGDLFATNGQLTLTFPSESLVVDGGDCDSTLFGGQTLNDQSGALRVAGAACDIGAAERLGTDTLSVTAPSGDCSHFSFGVDVNDNGMLDSAEIQSTADACLPTLEPQMCPAVITCPPAGSESPSTPQATVLIQKSDAPGDESCAKGVRITSGSDDNGNGALDDAEIDATDFVCTATSVATARGCASTTPDLGIAHALLLFAFMRRVRSESKRRAARTAASSSSPIDEHAAHP